MKAAGATLDRQVSADGGGDRPVRNTRSSGTQQQQQPSKPPTKVIVVQAPKAGAVQAALPTKTILIHPPNSTNNAQRIGNNNNNNNNNSSNSSPSMQHVVVHRQSPASPSTITVTLSDSELRQAVSEQSAATALYTTQPGTPLAYVTTQPEFGSVAAATQLVAGTAVHPHHASTQHHMDPYPLSAPTPHHHLQTTYCRTWPPGTYTVYAESYPYYQQYQPSLHSPAQGGQTTYIIPSGQQTSPNSLDDESAGHLSHTTRASPATIQWLLQNYETAEGVSLPRCTLYSHYLRHCADNKLDPVNAASFGKLIRSVFLGLRTRRLGTRGNSKYHYYGIRIKPESPLNRVTEDQMPMAMRNTPQHPGRTKQQRMSTRSASGGGGSGEFSSSGQQQTTAASTPSPGYPSQPNSLNAAYATGSVDSNNSFNDVPDDNHRQMLGSGEVPDVPGPDEQGLEAAVQPLGLTLHQVARFVNGYKQNNEDVLECIKNLRFGEIDECWRNFWQPENEQEENEEDKDGESQSGLSQSQLFSLSTVPQIQQYVQNMDFAFYQVLVDVLIPDVLKNIPAPLTQQIRNFAKSLENQLMLAMQGAPDVMQKMKLTAVKTLAQTLRRYTSLNHLAQAARAVLQQPQQITQMLNDLNRVDFVNVQEQATWVCKCDPLLVEQLQTNFKANLGKQKTLEQWAEWLEAVVDQVLASYHDKSLHEIANVAKQFLLKWSFYSSMVIRDLTLRSAQSFGSFHLIRLLYDEYMFYLVEQRLAKAANLSCIAVMAQHPDLFPNASLPVNLHTSEPIFINGAADVLMGNMEDFEEQRALPITGREDEQTGRDDRPDEQHPTITDHTQAASPHRLSDDTADIGAVKRARLE